MLEWIVSFSPTMRLLFALLFIVALMRARVPFGWAFLAGAGLVAILFPMNWDAFGKAVAAGVFSQSTAFLVLMVVSIMTLSSAMDETGQINRIIDAFKAMVGASRWTLVTFPALIGLLPMPGGAIFSAPMVEAAVKDSQISLARSTVANYWFRHIWEFWFPLYPGVILCLTLSGAPTGRYILMQLPMTLWALAAGYAIILRGVRLGEKRKRSFSIPRFKVFAQELTPILIVVAVVAILVPIADYASAKALEKGWLAKDSILLHRSPLIIGLLLGISWLFLRRGLTWRRVGGILRSKHVWSMAFMAVGLMAFQSVLERCGAVGRVREELAGLGVPLAVVVCALPFVAGVVVGLAFGFVATSFPFVIPLLAVIPEDRRLPWYFLAYTMGYVGMMFSPVHICLMLTAQYFKANLVRVYAYLTPLCLSTALVAAGLFVLYCWL